MPCQLQQAENERPTGHSGGSKVHSRTTPTRPACQPEARRDGTRAAEGVSYQIKWDVKDRSVKRVNSYAGRSVIIRRERAGVKVREILSPMVAIISRPPALIGELEAFAIFSRTRASRRDTMRRRETMTDRCFTPAKSSFDLHVAATR